MKAFVFVLAFGLVAMVACGGVFDRAGCTSDADCGDGRCLFPVGSCGSAGQCFAKESGPMCNMIEEFCGCDGQPVVGGCGFPEGFASGPTTGSPAIDCNGH